ncbi:hypothetical protein J1N10_10665 [Carboxylicivirga sp. A043]|uniref:hypothetical protein n=1 Tax=Carboxylicivirga litoralis TaxID=2816963 RepID=UPI0021CB219A|nr:hypothetical protein [Carboxylicivirga sp. A043]MCU4156441.1 hypothetical protein [Carboxylicivirga sp. A043]
MIELFNGHIKLSIEEPHEGYVGTRFDWTGKVVQLWWKNTPLCSTELAGSNSFMQGKGFFNEFGISEAIGYDSCQPGDYFPKIGVGLLKKENAKPYDFFHQYDNLPFEFTTRMENLSVTLACINRHPQSAFYLEKKISLTDSGFIIDYQLENRGHLVFSTNEYVHNFLSPGNRFLSKHTQLSIGDEINALSFSEGLNPGDCLSFSKNQISWQCTPVSDFFFENIAQVSGAGKHWTLLDKQLKLALSERVDFIPHKINLWGRAHVLSPELFKNIKLMPGETDRWQRVFEIQEIE